jgi:hypothetical protein
MKKLLSIIAGLALSCGVALADATVPREQIAFNFSLDFSFKSQQQRRTVIAEDPPYYLLFENSDRILTENNDLLEKEHL